MCSTAPFLLASAAPFLLSPSSVSAIDISAILVSLVVVERTKDQRNGRTLPRFCAWMGWHGSTDVPPPCVPSYVPIRSPLHCRSSLVSSSLLYLAAYSTVHDTHSFPFFYFLSRLKRPFAPSARLPKRSDRTGLCRNGSVCERITLSSGTPGVVTGVVPSWVCKLVAKQ
jgi:hypothetical protein